MAVIIVYVMFNCAVIEVRVSVRAHWSRPRVRAGAARHRAGRGDPLHVRRELLRVSDPTQFPGGENLFRSLPVVFGQ